MKLVLSTYDGTSITTYNAKITGLEPPQLKADVIESERVENPVSFGGKSFQAAEFEIIFVLRDSDANRNADIEAVGKLFDPRMKRTLKVLVATDSLDSNTQYYMDCTPLRFPKIEGKAMTVKMWSADPVWKKVTASTKTISVTSSPFNDSLTNNGNVDAYPVITVTPTSQGGGYVYRYHVIAYNPLLTRAQTHHPLDVTFGGIDLTTLAKDTSKSNQINVGGGISNSATTWAIDTAVGGGLPSTGGYFMMESEQCSYTSITGGNTVNGAVRGINGTTAVTHADNVVMYQSLTQADGDDIRLMVDGTETERWLGGVVYSDTTLKIWGVFDFPPGASATLKTALAASGETAVVFKNTVANQKAIKAMPDAGLLYIGTECIAYTARNVTKLSLTIANSGRGVKDTTAATHAVSDAIYWIPFNIVILVGNMSAEAPVQTNAFKPAFSLENSTNTNWRWDSADSVFGDVAGLRAGSWKPSKPKGVYSQWYTGNQGTVGSDPITDMGAEIVSYQSGSLYKVETAHILWTLQVNAVITSLSSLGEKYKYASNTPFPTCRLQSSSNGVDWVVEWTEAAPGSAATWTAWTRASEALPAGTRFVRFGFFGAVNAVANAVARNEINLGSAGSMGASFTSANVPQGTILARTSSAYIAFTLENTTTGESLEYEYPMKLNEALTLDTEARTVKYKDVFVSPPEYNSVRQEWLRLQPGTNNLTYTDPNTGNVTVVLTYKERKNL